MWAKRAIRESPEKHKLKHARYTPCRPCEENPDASPTWALRASNVTHDEEAATISYEDVRFEAVGVPIFYIPYFSHPDGSITQKSGFLRPTFGFDSDFGFNAMMSYYWAVNPYTDMTTGVRVFSDANPQANLEFRRRFNDAEMKLVTSGTYSGRLDRSGGRLIDQNEEARGHAELTTMWAMNDHWRSGTELALTSDESYLEEYNISDEDVLTNRIYVERFDNRDYASVELLAFQDLRLDRTVDQPNALPLANMTFVSKPDLFAGGRLRWDNNFLSLFREGNEQDMNRLNSTLGWQRQDILPGGLTSKLDLAMRGDVYYTSDRDISKIDPNEGKDKTDTRMVPTVNLEVAYPLQKRLKTSQIQIKPRVGLTARPDVDNDSDIPNEDSSDAQLDYTNLFEADRFPGFDRVEDRTRVNYGIETGYYTDSGNQFTAALGQSYRFDNDDNPFPEGSGLNMQSSDIVGQLGASFDNHRHNLNYRFQLNGQTLASERHEIYGGTAVGRADMSMIYLFEKGSEGTEFVDSREQVQASATYRLDEEWRLSGRTLYDLGEDPGLRESGVGLSYDNDCFGVTASWERDLKTDESGSKDTRILLSFRLKNLGEFETTAYNDSINSQEGN